MFEVHIMIPWQLRFEILVAHGLEEPVTSLGCESAFS